MTALYIIVSVIVAYYVLKFSMRLLLPFAMKKLTERMLKKAQQGQGGFTYTSGGGSPFGQQGSPFGNGQARRDRPREEKIQVDYVPNKEEKRKGTATAGEFIDFEEVK